MDRNNNNSNIWVELEGYPTTPIIVENKVYISQVKHYIRQVKGEFPESVGLPTAYFNLVQVVNNNGMERESGVLDTYTRLDSLGFGDIRLRIKIVQQGTRFSPKRKIRDDKVYYDFNLYKKYKTLKLVNRELKRENERKDNDFIEVDSHGPHFSSNLFKNISYPFKGSSKFTNY